MAKEHYYLKVSRKSFTQREDLAVFEKNLVREFKSYDFMAGYVLGYGFGKIEILTLSEVESINNDPVNNYLSYSYLFLVSVKNEK